MENGKVLGVLLLAALCMCGVAHATEPLDSPRAFSHYQSVVAHQETGVYEWNGLLFAHVRRPFDRRRETRSKARIAASIEITELLYRWAMGQTAHLREEKRDLPRGIALAKKIVAQYDPNWLTREWSISVSMREFPERVDGDDYLLGQIFDIEALRKSIPESFKKPLPDRQWLSELGRVVTDVMEHGNRRSFLVACGALDGIPQRKKGDVLDPECKNDEQQAQALVKDFLSASAIAKDMRDRVRSITLPRERSNLTVSPGEPVATEKNDVSITTNLFQTVVCVTNVVTRPQRSSEIVDMGLSNGGKVRDKTIDSTMGEIETVITKTVVTTTKYELHKVTHVVTGEACFEEMFLSGGEYAATIESRPQTVLGRDSEKLFYAKTSLDVKEATIRRALAENPYDCTLWNLLGRCYQARGEFAASLICFRMALRLDVHYQFAWTNLAETYQTVGCKRLAIGAALVARGLANDAWCIEHAEKVLLQP